MYSFNQVKRGINHPQLIGRELNRQYHTRFGRYAFNPDGINVFAADWDNLIILDACRYDMFAEYNTIEGQLARQESRGASTIEFLRGNFQDPDLTDTVYVTANPQLQWHTDDIDTTLHAEIDLWEDTYWDDEYNTVLPETVTEQAIQAEQDYPDKRLVVHYMQPHFPFIADTTDIDYDGVALEDRFWYKHMTNQIALSESEVWTLYTQNLERAMPHIADLVDALSGKTVVTADHGNMVGERSTPIPITEWGHPTGVYTSELVHVPWLVVDGEDRKQIQAEKSAEESSTTDEKQVRDRLRQLGYDG